MEKDILIVDDEESITELLVDLLGESFSVDSSNSPFDAISKCEKIKYKCLISDIYMPGINGYELAKKLKHNNSISKIIFMSGCKVNPSNQYLEFEKELFIKKPFSLRKMFEIVKNIV